MEELKDSRGMTEAEAIARYRSRNYPKPAMTADIVVFAREGEGLKVLLIRRKGHPFIGKLALPGGFANENESVEQTAARELEEETGVAGLELKLVDVFSKPGRDPRGWVVSVAFASVVDSTRLNVQAGDDAAEAAWYDVSMTADGLKLHYQNVAVNLSELSFDHEEVLIKALNTI